MEQSATFQNEKVAIWDLTLDERNPLGSTIVAALTTSMELYFELLIKCQFLIFLQNTFETFQEMLYPEHQATCTPLYNDEKYSKILFRLFGRINTRT